MAKMLTYLVVMVDSETGLVYFDGDGSREWIRTLFEKPTNTYDTEDGEFVAVAPYLEEQALNALQRIGVIFENEDEWRQR